MAAPVCRLQPPPPTFNSSAPQLPSIPLVSINPQQWNIPQPVINDIVMMAQAINSIRLVLDALTGAGAPANNVQSGIGSGSGGGGRGGGGGGGGSSSNPSSKNTKNPTQQKQSQQKKQGGGFIEVSRNTK